MFTYFLVKHDRLLFIYTLVIRIDVMAINRALCFPCHLRMYVPAARRDQQSLSTSTLPGFLIFAYTAAVTVVLIGI